MPVFHAVLFFFSPRAVPSDRGGGTALRGPPGPQAGLMDRRCSGAGETGARHIPKALIIGPFVPRGPSWPPWFGSITVLSIERRGSKAIVNRVFFTNSTSVSRGCRSTRRWAEFMRHFYETGDAANIPSAWEELSTSPLSRYAGVLPETVRCTATCGASTDVPDKTFSEKTLKTGTWQIE